MSNLQEKVWTCDFLPKSYLSGYSCIYIFHLLILLILLFCFRLLQRKKQSRMQKKNSRFWKITQKKAKMQKWWSMLTREINFSTNGYTIFHLYWGSLHHKSSFGVIFQNYSSTLYSRVGQKLYFSSMQRKFGSSHLNVLLVKILQVRMT